MGKKAWIIFISIAITLIVVVLVLMLILVPQMKSYTATTEDEYSSIKKSDYVFDGTRTTDSLKKEYTVTSEDVINGKNTNKYAEGNINPFTPKEQVTIYNEPTVKPNNGSGTLSPSDK